MNFCPLFESLTEQVHLSVGRGDIPLIVLKNNGPKHVAVTEKKLPKSERYPWGKFTFSKNGCQGRQQKEAGCDALNNNDSHTDRYTESPVQGKGNSRGPWVQGNYYLHPA